MKKTILLAVVIISVATNANAQIKKGAIFLGGQFSFYNQNEASGGSTQKQTGIIASPTFGKAIKENCVIGADVTFGYSTNDNGYPVKSVSSGLGFFVRQYKELGKGFYVFGQARASALYSSNDYHDIYNNQPVINNGKQLQASVTANPGIAYSISKKFQIETALNNLFYLQYNHYDDSYSGGIYSAKTNSFSLGTTFSSALNVSVGFRVLLN